MNKVDSAKLRVLIKRILLEKKPKQLTAKMLADIINEDSYGFQSNVSSKKISWMLGKELGNRQKNMFDNVCYVKKGKTNYYYIM